MSDHPLKKAISDAFGEKIFALMVETQSQLEHAGIDEGKVELFTVQLVCSAARVAIANKVNKETFAATVTAILDREFQPPLEAGLTTRQRGSA